LSQLASGQLGLEDVLTRIAQFAVKAIPGADGAGLTLLEAGHADTIVASAPFVAQVDAIQYGIHEGPCITAAAQARTVHSGALDTDPQWPRFGPLIGHLGVHSALSIPLQTPQGVLGALNIYAYRRDAFDDHGARIGELFAGPAAFSVKNAQLLAQTARLAAQLQVALTNQATIDQAIGIFMSRFGCSPEQALRQLRGTPRIKGEKLHNVAWRVVEDAKHPLTKRRHDHRLPSVSALWDLDVSLDYRDATRAVMTASGVLSTVTADVLAKVFKHRLQAGHRYLHLNVAGLVSCDQDGAKALVDAHHAFIAADGALVLVGVRPTLRNMLRLAGVDTVLFLARDRRISGHRWSAPSA